MLAEDGDVWRVFDVRKFDYPERIADYDAVIVTGSAADAHADEPWINRLNQAIRETYSQSVKILGVCFGHQAVANALGGQSGRNDLGWELGCRVLSLQAAGSAYAYMSGIEALKILEVHRDHVTRVPSGAEVLASAEKAPVQIYAIGAKVLGIQGHPEFNNDIVRDLIESRRQSGAIDPETAREALASLASEPDDARLRAMIQGFLRAS